MVSFIQSVRQNKERAMQNLTDKEHKELIKASLIELMSENKFFFKEIFSEIFGDLCKISPHLKL